MTLSFQKMVKSNVISTHTLTWSVTWEDFDFTLNKLNFNSHAHVERDVKYFVTPFTNKISTHTLTWSVTNPKGEYWNYFYISTHTLTWSVTR